MFQEAIQRICQMEQCFELLQKAITENPDALWEDPSLRANLDTLTGYYEDGQWLRDYELDEQGLLPRDLKRGVLSEDAVYNFLSQADHYRRRTTPAASADP